MVRWKNNIGIDECENVCYENGGKAFFVSPTHAVGEFCLVLKHTTQFEKRPISLLRVSEEKIN